MVAQLTVDVPSGFVSLASLCELLFVLRVQVVRAEEAYQEGRVVRRLFVCDFTGGPLRSRRRREIEDVLAVAVRAARFEPVKPPVRALPRDPVPREKVVPRPGPKQSPAVAAPPRSQRAA